MHAEAFVAVAPQQNVKAAFTVQKLEGKVPHTVHRFDKKTNKIVKKTTQVDAGFLVTFAKGHSIRAIDEDHLKQIGAGLSIIPVVDTETGEIKGGVRNPVADSLDETVEEHAAA